MKRIKERLEALEYKHKTRPACTRRAREQNSGLEG